MSLFGWLTGSDERDALKKNFKASEATRKEAEAAGVASIEQGIGEAGQSFDVARGDILSSIDDVLGRMGVAKTQARSDITGGYGEAEATAEEYRQKALEPLSQYLQSGAKAQQLWDDLQGLNGPEAQQRAQATYTANPMLQTMIDNAADDIDRAGRASGRGGIADSGLGLYAAAKASEDFRYQDRMRYESGLQAAGARGQAAATEASQITSNTGQLLSQLKAQRSQALAGVESDFAGKEAQVGTQKAGLLATNEQNRGNALLAARTNQGNIKYGSGMTGATNQINFGNAYGASYSRPLDMATKIAGVGAQLYTGYQLNNLNSTLASRSNALFGARV